MNKKHKGAKPTKKVNVSLWNNEVLNPYTGKPMPVLTHHSIRRSLIKSIVDRERWLNSTIGGFMSPAARVAQRMQQGALVKRVAAELGMSANCLRTWRDLALGKGRGAPAAATQPPARSTAPFADPAAEIRRLQREVEYLRRQREILKKAMSILSEEPTSGMR